MLRGKAKGVFPFKMLRTILGGEKYIWQVEIIMKY
jgi:hypothetical protein